MSSSEWTAEARVRISGGRGSAIERTLSPTPYETELIVEDVAHAGRGAHVEIDVGDLGEAAIALLEISAARLARRGIHVIWSGLATTERA